MELSRRAEMEIYSINLLPRKFYYVAISADAKDDNKYQLRWRSLTINFHPRSSTASRDEAHELHNDEHRELIKRFFSDSDLALSDAKCH